MNANKTENKKEINFTDHLKNAVTLAITADGSAAIALVFLGVIPASVIPIRIGSAVIPYTIKFIAREMFEENAGINIAASAIGGAIKYTTNDPTTIDGIKGAYNGVAYELAHNEDIAAARAQEHKVHNIAQGMAIETFSETIIIDAIKGAYNTYQCNKDEAPAQAQEHKVYNIVQGVMIEISESLLGAVLKCLFDSNVSYLKFFSLAGKGIKTSGIVGLVANISATFGFGTVRSAVEATFEAAPKYDASSHEAVLSGVGYAVEAASGCYEAVYSGVEGYVKAAYEFAAADEWQFFPA
jgi:hypothetical protein